MATTKVKGIIIENKDYKEKDILATIYTVELGKVKALFKGVKGEKAKLKAHKNIFTFAEFVLENTKGNNIVSQVDLIEGFYNLSQELDKFYEACSIVDIVKKLGSEQSDPVFFLEFVKALKNLNYYEVSKNLTLIKFLLKVFEGAGYPINFLECSSCKAMITGRKFFNFEIGEIVCGNCKKNTSIEISPLVFSSLKIINQTPYEKLKSIKINNDGIMGALRLLSDNFEWRFGCKFFMT